MKIVIETIPHDSQRYETVGDWYQQGGDLVIKVSELGDWRMEAMVAVHELVEAILCKNAGVTEDQIDTFDFWFAKTREFNEGQEAGDQVRAPYRDQHCYATAVERMLCAALGIPWLVYDAKVNALVQSGE